MTYRSTLICRLALGLTLAGLSACASTNTPQKQGRSAEVHSAIAAQYVRRGELDAAQRHAQIALDAEPRDGDALTIMAVVLQREGSRLNLIKAEDFYKRAIAVTKGNDRAKAENNYAVFLSQQGRLEESLALFESAGSTLGYAGRSASLENLGRTALKLNRIEVAQRAFEGAIDADSGSLIARVELVDIYLSQSQTARAAKLYNDYITLLGNNNMGARTLWQGIRIAQLRQDSIDLRRLGLLLTSSYPNSVEARRYALIPQ